MKIKAYLEKGKLMENEWKNDDKLNSLINDCINIEISLKDIILINENIEKFNKCDKINLKFINHNDNLIESRKLSICSLFG